VPKNSTDFGQITQTQAAVFGVRQSFAWNETSRRSALFLETVWVARRAPTFFLAAMGPSRTKRGGVEAGRFFAQTNRHSKAALF
jgi:hypothetical protein